MLKTVDERTARQRAMKKQNQVARNSNMMSLEDCAIELNVSLSTARRIFRFEPGVEAIPIPGSKRPLIRVPRQVFEAYLRRSANPYRSQTA